MNAEKTKPIPDFTEASDIKEVELVRSPVELKSGEWNLKLVPWIGGRINSMIHIPTGCLLSLS